MRETPITIIGNVVTTPKRRKLESGDSVTSFRIASTSRRYDAQRGEWADGNSLFVSVNCWQQLGDNVHRSAFLGDPVVVTGWLYTREYEVDGQRRSSFEVKASAVGLDLCKGVSASFERTRSSVQPTFEVVGEGGDDDDLGDADDELGTDALSADDELAPSFELV